MDLRSRGERPYVICGMLALIVFVAAAIAIDIIDPNWTFGPNALSEMSVSPVPGVKELFACACAVTGLLAMAFGVGKMLFEKNWAYIGGALAIGAGFFIMLVGLIPADVLEPHNYAAGLMVIFLAGAIILATVNEILDGSRFMLVFGIAIGLLALSTSFLPLGFAEVAGILCGILWFIVHFIRYFLRGFRCTTPDDKVWCP